MIFALCSSAVSASAYDQARVEALEGALSIAALCLEKYGDRETFEIVFDRLSTANAGNPDPTSRVEIQGYRDGVLDASKKVNLTTIKDSELRPVCQKLRKDPDDW